MNRTLTRLCVCAVLSVPLALVAQEESAEGAADAGSTGEMSVGDIEKSIADAAAAKSGAKRFHALVKLAYSCENVSV